MLEASVTSASIKEEYSANERAWWQIDHKELFRLNQGLLVRQIHPIKTMRCNVKRFEIHPIRRLFKMHHNIYPVGFSV